MCLRSNGSLDVTTSPQGEVTTSGDLLTETAAWLFWWTHEGGQDKAVPSSPQGELRTAKSQPPHTVTRIHAGLPFLAIESSARKYGKGTTIYTLNHYRTTGVDFLSEGFDCTVVTELLVLPSLQELSLEGEILPRRGRCRLLLLR